MYITAGILIFLMLSAGMIFTSCASFGYEAKGERLERVKKSENFKDEVFVNNIEAPLMVKGFGFGALKKMWFDNSVQRSPEKPVPVVKVKKETFLHLPESGFRVTWIGHSTLLVEMNGHKILTDPLFRKRASPFSWAGPARFYECPASVSDLPDLDIVVISHDHYDHLNHKDIKELIPKTGIFLAPLGVGAHLEGWGVPAEKIKELDWWQDYKFSDDLKLICTPARHFSGRGIRNRNTTLWASWIMRDKKFNVYFSGDSGYFPTYKEIGDRFGPFDISLMHIGAYSENWPFIHTDPEQAMQAHLDLKSGAYLPIHWGTYNLAMHSWYDPIERTLKAAEKNNVKLLLPKPGESVTLDQAGSMPYWWRECLIEDQWKEYEIKNNSDN